MTKSNSEFINQKEETGLDETTTQQILGKSKELEATLTSSLFASEVKWRLFVCAVISDGPKELDLPVFVTSMEKLLRIIQNTPSFNVLRTQLPKNSCKKNIILFLHWLLVECNYPTLQLLDTDEYVHFLDYIQLRHNEKAPTVAYSIIYAADCKEENIFESKKSQFGSKCAFFGCNPDNLYYLLYDNQLTHKGNSDDGRVYLSTKVTPILNKMPFKQSINVQNRDIVFKILAFCEFVNISEYIDTTFDKEYNSTNICILLPDIVRMRYLLYYAEPKQPISLNASCKQQTGSTSTKLLELMEPIPLNKSVTTIPLEELFEQLDVALIVDKPIKQQDVSSPTEDALESSSPISVPVPDGLEPLPTPIITNQIVEQTETFVPTEVSSVNDKSLKHLNNTISTKKSVKKRISKGYGLPITSVLILLGALTYLYGKNVKSFCIFAGQKFGKLFSESL